MKNESKNVPLQQGKIWLAAGMALLVLVFAVVSLVWDHERAWNFFQIDHGSHDFFDLQVLTSSGASLAEGWDPLEKHPHDPKARPLNYPRIWQGLGLLGLGQQHFIGLGIALVAVFLGALWVIWPRLNRTQALVLLGGLASPAVMLGLERGNIDLVIFALLALAIVAVRHFRLLPVVLVLSAVVLKIFPVFACVLFLRENARVALLILGGCGILSATYFWATREDLRLIQKNTEKGTSLSYGYKVLASGVAEAQPKLAKSAHRAAVIALGVLGGGALLAAAATLRAGHLPPVPAEAAYLDAFRVGAAIYVGTFLLGANWDYRLMFLLFTIPRLVELAGQRESLAFRLLASGTLILVFGMLFNISIRRWLPAVNELGLRWADLADEGCNWLLWSSLIYLLLVQLPEWLTSYLQPGGYTVKEATSRMSP